MLMLIIMKIDYYVDYNNDIDENKVNGVISKDNAIYL